METTSLTPPAPHRLPQLIARLWVHIAPRRRMQLGLLLGLMLANVGAELLSLGLVLPFLAVLTNPNPVFSSAMIKPWLPLLQITEPRQLILPLTLAFSAAALLAGATRFSVLWAKTRLGYALGADLSIAAYERTLYQPYCTHLMRSSSELITALTHKVGSVINATIIPLLSILVALPPLLFIVCALFYIAPGVALAAILGFSGIYVSIILLCKQRLLRYGAQAAQSSTQVTRALQEGLGAIRDVLLDHTQAVYCQNYREAELNTRQAQARILIISASPRPLVETLGMVLIAAIAFSLTGQNDRLASSIPVLGALALAAQRLLPLLQTLYEGWSMIRGAQNSLFDTLQLMEQPLPAGAHSPPPEPLPFVREITLEKIAFRYRPQAPWVLENVQLTITRGMRVGFIGKTGSGKSTLLDILTGLIAPSAGRLRIDGVTLTAENSPAWQRHIAHVPQMLFLSEASIEENIALGVPRHLINPEKVRKAAHLAQIAQTIETWPAGYQTPVGERGIRLSGGQRQRIGIARALYKEADVIVFDEATSALDSQTEESVMEAINALHGEITVLLIAHRLSTLRSCDWVVELADRTISQQGTFAQIIGRSTAENEISP
jgi:ABC-type bacteriocin/lantibiotic exporter with double-glycine peptidase domain